MISIPPNMRGRPRTPAGLPIPWFVDTRRRPVDFRVIRPEAPAWAWNQQICWLCGEKLGRFQCYVIGPVSVITRVHSEPPCHRVCAEYAAQACPFLANPDMTRGARDYPEGTQPPAHGHNDANPGVVAIWVAEATRHGRGAQPTVDNLKRVLFELTHAPVEVVWFHRGRRATRPEVYYAMEPRLITLLTAARQDGPQAVSDLKTAVLEANKLLPLLRPGDAMPGSTP